MSNKRIALIGLDGSGKSANIDIMKKDSDYANYHFLWVRWKPTLLKPLYKVIGNKTAKKNDSVLEVRNGIELCKTSDEQIKLRTEYNNKSGLKKKIFKNPVIRKIWIFLATVDYFIQFYAKTTKFLVKGDKIIFDRYYLDLYVDQGINFGYKPDQIAREINRHQWLFPKMSKIIYIKVSPEICYLRKDDIPNMDYLEKRYAIYEYIAKIDNWTVIDGEQALNDVNKSIKNTIL